MLTTEMALGVPLERTAEMSQEARDKVCDVGSLEKHILVVDTIRWERGPRSVYLLCWQIFPVVKNSRGAHIDLAECSNDMLSRLPDCTQSDGPVHAGAV